MRKEVMGVAPPIADSKHPQDVVMGGDFTMENVIFEYTLAEAVSDGVLVPLGWANGKPLIGTAGTVEDLPSEERQRLFTEFLKWQKSVAPSLGEEDRMFVTNASNNQKVWIIDDGAAITLLYPSEY